MTPRDVPTASEAGSDRRARRDTAIPLFTRFRIALVRAFLVAWMRAFSLSGLYALGRFFGILEYLCDYNRRRRVHRKLIEYFKDEAVPEWRRPIVRRYFMRVRCDKMFYTIMDRIPRDKLMNRIKMFGRDHLDAALARNKGVYIAFCHFGAHHVAGLLGALLGYSIAGVRDPKESPVRRYIQNKYRETFPEVAKMKLFFNDEFPRELYRCFQANRVVASLLDIDRPKGDGQRTLPATLFGETREMLTGPLRIAVRCGAVTLQGFVVSRPNYYYRIIVTPPILDPDAIGPDENRKIARALQAYADQVERHAREHPDHLMKI